MTWQEAARGIPAWVGAKVIERDNTMAGTVVQVRKNGRLDVWCGDHCEDMDDAWFPGDCVPDLADPDTRAMYLRRLAVALGCPESTASIGVTFQASGDGYECAAGRKITMEGGTFTPWRWHTGGDVRFAVADECVALALAWPADKRVTT